MRFPFRRQPKGRHALGAAVTAIPSAPVQVAVAVDTSAVRVAPPPASQNAVAPVPLPAPPAEPVEPTSAVPPAGSPTTPAPVVVEDLQVQASEPLRPPAAPLSSFPVQPVDLEPALLDLLGSFDAPPAVPPPVLPAPSVPAPPLLALTTGPAPAAAPSAPTGPRVELGFADGSVRTLDPSSSAAQELSDLVAELTSKSAVPGPSAS